jgi:hypothetical protein
MIRCPQWGRQFRQPANGQHSSRSPGAEAREIPLISGPAIFAAPSGSLLAVTCSADFQIPDVVKDEPAIAHTRDRPFRLNLSPAKSHENSSAATLFCSKSVRGSHQHGHEPASHFAAPGLAGDAVAGSDLRRSPHTSQVLGQPIPTLASSVFPWDDKPRRNSIAGWHRRRP